MGTSFPKIGQCPTLLLFVKEDVKACCNYRGINVTSSLRKLYGRILKNIMEREFLYIYLFIYDGAMCLIRQNNAVCTAITCGEETF